MKYTSKASEYINEFSWKGERSTHFDSNIKSKFWKSFGS